MNVELARDTLQTLVDCGVEEFVVCPGARNTPFINVLINEKSLKSTYAFEERSAAFYALGRIRSTKRPVGVVTTSGTAAAELLPAAMEAYYTSLPLVLLTADRPKRMRHINAPQTVNQKNLYGIYTPHEHDIELSERADLNGWQALQPLHLNVCFEEPERAFVSTKPLHFPIFKTLAPAFRGSYEPLIQFIKEVEKPLVVVSSLPENSEKAVLQFLKQLGAPAYIEGTSNLRDKFPSATPDLKSYDSVLRIGGVPTHRLWRDLETTAHEVLSISECPFSGLSRSALIHAPLASFFSNFTPMPKVSPSNLPVMDYNQEELLIHELSKKLPLNSLVYLGNSMPIRHWDKAATFEDRGYKILASRGTNGIDGQLSTFFGLAEPSRSNWCILGDLTALYDLTAPWFLSQLPHNINIVIINNRGGRIFEKMFPGPEMLNSHNLSFEPVAKLWNLSYEKWREVPSDISGPSPRLIELAL